MQTLKHLFLLDPGVAYLNHGSFGATPEPVFREYQRWQRELEREPTEFLGRRFEALMQSVREALGAYLGVPTRDVVLTENVSFAINIVARSLKLGPGDEVLSTNHEYGACDRIWRFLARKRGFRYVTRAVRVPLVSSDELVEDFMRGVNPSTRLIFVSHITSPTGILFPVEEICRRARSRGVLTVVDGAHAPGQIPLKIPDVGADFYGGNLHKWLCAPKGAGFLYARPEVQHLLEPLVVSWGYESETPSGSKFVDHFQWHGTSDIAAFLSVPAAIQFQKDHDWGTVIATCHALLTKTLGEIRTITQIPAYYPDDSWYVQMACAPLPDGIDAAGFQKRLYDEHRIEVPVRAWNNWKLMRISIQAYNEQEDAQRLLLGIRALI